MLKRSLADLLPSFAESHGCKPVDECEVGTLRSLGDGGCASEGSALGSVWRGATAVRPSVGLHFNFSEGWFRQTAPRKRNPLGPRRIGTSVSTKRRGKKFPGSDKEIGQQWIY